MVSVSSLLTVEVDELGRPLNLKATDETDTLASSILSTEVKVLLTEVNNSAIYWASAYDVVVSNKPVWDSGGAPELPADVSGAWQNAFNYSNSTSANTNSVFNTVYAASSTWEAGGAASVPSDVSGNWENAYKYTNSASGNLGNTSSYVGGASGNLGNTSSYVGGASGNIGNTSSYVFNGSGNITNTSSYVRSASGNLGNTSSYVFNGSGNLGNTSSYVFNGSGNIGNTSSYVFNGSGNLGNTSSYVFNGSGNIGNTSSYVGGASGNIGNTSSYVRSASGNISNTSSYVGGASGNIGNTSSYVGGASGNIGNTSSYVGGASGNIGNTSSYVAGASGNIGNTSSYVGGASGTITQLSASVSATVFNASGDWKTAYIHSQTAGNPHGTTAAQVGNTTAQWNASAIASREVIINGGAALSGFLKFTGGMNGTVEVEEGDPIGAGVSNFLATNTTNASALQGSPVSALLTAIGGDVLVFDPELDVWTASAISLISTSVSSTYALSATSALNAQQAPNGFNVTGSLLATTISATNYLNIRPNVSAVDSATTTTVNITGDYDLYLVNTTTTGVTLYLPPAASWNTKQITISKVDDSGSYRSVTVSSSELQTATNTVILYDPTESVTVVSNGTNWYSLDYDRAYGVVTVAKNNTGATLTKGTPVKVTGALGSNILVGPVSALNTSVPTPTDPNFQHCFGVVEHDIPDGEFGHILRVGVLFKYNTNSYSLGDILYVASGGGLTNIKPVPPYEEIYIGVVSRVNVANGSIVIDIQNPEHINDIVGMNLASSLVNGDLISYDSTTSTFKNVQTISVSGQGKFGSVSATTYDNLGNTIAKWNASAIRGISVTNALPNEGDVLTYTAPNWVATAPLSNTTAQWNASALRGTSLSSTLNPTTGQSLVYSGTVWIASSITLVTNATSATNAFSSTNALSATSALNAQQAPNGFNVTGTLKADSVSATNYLNIGNTTAQWNASALRGSPLSSTLVPTTGQSLVYTGSVWTASSAAGGGGVTDHGALTGLADDDHPQYALLDGTRPFDNQALKIWDSVVSYPLIFANNSSQAEDHYLYIETTNPAINLVIRGDLTVGAAGAQVVGSNNGDVTLAGSYDYLTLSGQVLTRNKINLATQVSGDLPLSSLTPASSTSVLLGRGSTASGDFQQITLGSGLTMSGTTISASKPTLSKAITLLYPLSSDYPTLALYTPIPITITSAIANISPSSTGQLTYNIVHSTSGYDRNNGANLIKVFTSDVAVSGSQATGDIESSGFNDNTIPANSYVWFRIYSVPTSPATEVFYGTFIYTED